MSYSNQYSRGKRKYSQRGTRWLRLLFVALFLLLGSGVVFTVYEYRQHPAWSASIADYRGRLTTWIAERKQHLNQKVAIIKRNVGDSEDADRTVNFEFYHTLQDMQPMQVAAQAEARKSQELKTAVKSVQAPKPAKTTKIVHAADLENDLLAAIKQGGGQ